MVTLLVKKFSCCHYFSEIKLNNFVCFRLLSIAEETLAEFLSKATGTAVEWVQMPGMKVCPRSNSFNFLSVNCIV